MTGAGTEKARSARAKERECEREREEKGKGGGEERAGAREGRGAHEGAIEGANPPPHHTIANHRLIDRLRILTPSLIRLLTYIGQCTLLAHALVGASHPLSLSQPRLLLLLSPQL